mmetsp:Transcript_26010/g.57294  ORF Transcript_26010/g.57294 Transcript_26010/m.57294 type:complete len:246 (-) Transcript_26010:348-1085(-)
MTSQDTILTTTTIITTTTSTTTTTRKKSRKKKKKTTGFPKSSSFDELTRRKVRQSASLSPCRNTPKKPSSSLSLGRSRPDVLPKAPMRNTSSLSPLREKNRKKKNRVWFSSTDDTSKRPAMQCAPESIRPPQMAVRRVTLDKNPLLEASDSEKAVAVSKKESSKSLLSKKINLVSAMKKSRTRSAWATFDASFGPSPARRKATLEGDGWFEASDNVKTLADLLSLNGSSTELDLASVWEWNLNDE